ncbi:MAG: hypothetical protein LC099_03945 [Anaerolineales bacterium]|nr:hypothetical protein [Anaerolineales bacterium]
MKKIIPVLVLLAIFATACGSKTPAVPTMSVEDIQGTAIGVAFTMVAETQAAIPTNTPIPPTETPLPTLPPTLTPLPLPTLEPTSVAILPTATSSSGNDKCGGLLNIKEAGPLTNVRFDNQSGYVAQLAFFMYAPNEFAQCGSYYGNGMIIQPGGSSGAIALPAGNYYAYAWLTKDGKPVKGVEGYFTNTQDTHVFVYYIRADSIR